MTTKKAALRISRSLELPVDVVTRATAILANRGAGKTYTGAVFAEEALDVGVPVVALDPVGAWWGLRSSANGERKGYSIPIFGGEQADVPLEPAGGKVIADFVTGERASCVVDLSLFRKGEAVRFAVDFLETLYRRNRDPVLLVLEEADFFAPQKPKGTGGDRENLVPRMLGAVEDVVRRGRMRGLGVVMITQRSAVLNKDVLTQAELLIVLRTTSKQDRDAVDGWIEVHSDRAEGKAMLDALPTLPTGEAYVWAPSYGIFEHVKVRKRRTYDSSSAPPLVGGGRERPAGYAPIDYDSLRERMAEAIEKAEAVDPEKLKSALLRERKRSGELEKQLRDRPTEAVEKTVEVPVEVPVISDESVERIERLIADMRELERDVSGLLNATADQLAQALRSATRSGTRQAPARPLAATRETPRVPLRHERQRPAAPREPADSGGIEGEVTPKMRKLLDALAWLETAGIAPATRLQMAMVAGYHPRTKAFTNGLGTLSSNGLIEYPVAGSVALTDAGRDMAEAPPAPLSDEALQEMIFDQVGPKRTRILRELIDAYPEAISRPELAARLEYHERTKAFTNGLGGLSTLGLIAYPQPGYVAAEPILFPVTEAVR